MFRTNTVTTLSLLAATIVAGWATDGEASRRIVTAQSGSDNSGGRVSSTGTHSPTQQRTSVMVGVLRTDVTTPAPATPTSAQGKLQLGRKQMQQGSQTSAQARRTVQLRNATVQRLNDVVHDQQSQARAQQVGGLQLVAAGLTQTAVEGTTYQLGRAGRATQNAALRVRDGVVIGAMATGEALKNDWNQTVQDAQTVAYKANQGYRRSVQFVKNDWARTVNDLRAVKAAAHGSYLQTVDTMNSVVNSVIASAKETYQGVVESAPAQHAQIVALWSKHQASKLPAASRATLMRAAATLNSARGVPALVKGQYDQMVHSMAKDLQASGKLPQRLQDYVD